MVVLVVHSEKYGNDRTWKEETDQQIQVETLGLGPSWEWGHGSWGRAWGLDRAGCGWPDSCEVAHRGSKHRCSLQYSYHWRCYRIHFVGYVVSVFANSGCWAAAAPAAVAAATATVCGYCDYA